MEKEYAVGLEINANNIRGKSERIVKTTGFLIHKGKTTIVWDIKITDGQNDKLICIARCTRNQIIPVYQNLPNPTF